MENIITIEGLTKFYGGFQALYGVDLKVKQGEIFGFLGPNGAGKTTTIRCLIDTIHRSGGKIEVFGIDSLEEPVSIRARIGYLPGELNIDSNSTGKKLLRYYDQLRGNSVNWNYVEKLAATLKLDLSRQIKNLSHGNKQKVGIIQAFMHKPELIILDEPTQGLDPLMQQEVLKMIKEVQEEGSTVFFSSHIMGEVQAVADRVGIIRDGKIVEVSETSSLISRSLNRIHIRFQKDVNASELGKIKGVSILSEDSNNVTLQIEGEMDTLIKALAKFPVSDFETRRPSLEEIFLAYYEGGK